MLSYVQLRQGVNPVTSVIPMQCSDEFVSHPSTNQQDTPLRFLLGIEDIGSGKMTHLSNYFTYVRLTL